MERYSSCHVASQCKVVEEVSPGLSRPFRHVGWEDARCLLLASFCTSPCQSRLPWAPSQELSLSLSIPLSPLTASLSLDLIVCREDLEQTKIVSNAYVWHRHIALVMHCCLFTYVGVCPQLLVVPIHVFWVPVEACGPPFHVHVWCALEAEFSYSFALNIPGILTSASIHARPMLITSFARHVFLASPSGACVPRSNSVRRNFSSHTSRAVWHVTSLLVRRVRGAGRPGAPGPPAKHVVRLSDVLPHQAPRQSVITNDGSEHFVRKKH